MEVFGGTVLFVVGSTAAEIEAGVAGIVCSDGLSGTRSTFERWKCGAGDDDDDEEDGEEEDEFGTSEDETGIGDGEDVTDPCTIDADAAAGTVRGT